MVYKSYSKSVCSGYPVKYLSLLSSRKEINFSQEGLGQYGILSLCRYLYTLILCLTSSRT